MFVLLDGLLAIRVSFICKQKLQQCQTKRISNEKRTKLNCVRWKSYKFSSLAHERRIANAISFILILSLAGSPSNGKSAIKRICAILPYNIVARRQEFGKNFYLNNQVAGSGRGKQNLNLNNHFYLFSSTGYITRRSRKLYAIGRITFSFFSCFGHHLSSCVAIVHCYKNYKYIVDQLSRNQVACARV